MHNLQQLKDMSNAIRFLSMDAVEKANSGHPGMPMGMADVATVLFSEFLKYNPEDPNWPDRDRFILSAGHGSMLLYSLLYLTGYKDMTIDEIKNFRQLNSKTCGHPEYGHSGGIETTTGPLGQGLANSVGMAIAERWMAAKFGSDLVNHFTYVIAGDGCLMEGISHEAISFAGHLGLNKLILFFDNNNISIDGKTDLSVSDDQMARFKACNWNVIAINGHNYEEIRSAIISAKKSDKPSMICCTTIIAYGAPTKANSSASHGSPLGKEEIKGAREKLGWNYEPFVIPQNILNDWQLAGKRSKEKYIKWHETINSGKSEIITEFNQFIKGDVSQIIKVPLEELRKKFMQDKPVKATRELSGIVLESITKSVPNIIGGSADLTGSNKTKTSSTVPITRDNFSGRYIYYGVREHAMAAIMNGMALHKGIIPYGGTFLVFTDYCKPAIRLSALMKQRVIYVMTHDSIGVGEDGPTHQPVEHLASLRSIPNLQIFRPADAIETLECWEIALNSINNPSVLVLTRQNVIFARETDNQENLSAKGAYIIRKSEISQNDANEVAIIATGSELSIAIEAWKILEKEKIAARVISMPCNFLFDHQSEEYKKSVFGKCKLRVAVEAAVSYGWEKYIGIDGIFVGMEGFGSSAPAEDLYKYFSITADNVVKKIKLTLVK